MKNLSKEQILKKVINRAVKNGFKQIAFGQDIKRKYKLRTFDKVEITFYEIIFDHEFAKAFFGEEEAHVFGKPISKKVWEIELQQLVLQKDPLKYLAKFL